MMKRCERCNKPLTEFETAFHEKANSPAAVSGKCWVCSGAELEFMDGYADKPHHRVEIFVCLLAAALIVALLIPMFPYMNEPSSSLGSDIYLYVVVIAYFAIGTVATVIIRRRGGKKPKIQEWDPPMTRYQNNYGPNTDIYTTKINRDGDFVTTKETRLGGSIEDKWGSHASSGSSVLDSVSNAYGNLLTICLLSCFYLLAGGTFAFWCLPYVLIMIMRDNVAKSHNKAVPKNIQSAYRYCRKTYGDAPISYSDKAGFLISREKHQTKKAEQKSGFLSHYQQASGDDSAPFFYTRKNNVSYMIVEYKREPNRSFGTTFLLVWDGGKELQKRIVVGNGFLPTDPHNWEQEWNEAGISSYAKEHLDWYEQKMKKILKSMKKNQEIVG